jgi:glutathione S-transferase
MKLYYFPGACSLAPHILLCETGVPYTLERVDLSNKLTENGTDYMTINPKGFVPALELSNGQILTEAQVLVQYIADQFPDKHLVPLAGSLARYRVMEWLSYIATDLQKGFAPLFNPETTDATRLTVQLNLSRHFDYIAGHLEEANYLVGDRYSIADAYLFTILNWAPYVEVDLGEWPVLGDYVAGIAQRPAVQAAMTAEQLM